LPIAKWYIPLVRILLRKLGTNFTKNGQYTPPDQRKELEPFSDATNPALFLAGATYADAITFGAEKTDKNSSRNSVR